MCEMLAWRPPSMCHCRGMATTITVPCRPEPLEVDPAKTAVIVINMKAA